MPNPIYDSYCNLNSNCFMNSDFLRDTYICFDVANIQSCFENIGLLGSDLLYDDMVW